MVIFVHPPTAPSSIRLRVQMIWPKQQLCHFIKLSLPATETRKFHLPPLFRPLRTNRLSCQKHGSTHYHTQYIVLAKDKQVRPPSSLYCSISRMNTLVNIQKTMGNHHLERDNSLFLWPCSLAMLNYQRVYRVQGRFALKQS